MKKLDSKYMYRMNKKMMWVMGIVIAYTVSGYAETMSIGVMQQMSPSSIIVNPDLGSYILFADGEKVLELGTDNLLQLTRQGEHVKVRSFDKEIGLFKKVMFLAEHADNTIRVKCIIPQSEVKVYDDHFEVSASRGSLRLVNKVDLEDYVAGVIESEVGYRANPEFMKAQAIIARTYALSNANRHYNDGFELCDAVHCQVYHHKSRQYQVLKAVDVTEGMILIDDKLHLITAAFHSNCGGQTHNSEDVWLTSRNYLRSVRDTFCTSQHNAYWEKEVSKKQWLSYLQRKSAASIDDSIAYSFPQDERQVFYACLDLPLKTIRNDWELKSTYFSVKDNGNTLVLSGRGYGHGVGLCQEGAMKMADYGKSFKDILYYYYKEINIVSIKALKFFLED